LHENDTTALASESEPSVKQEQQIVRNYWLACLVESSPVIRVGGQIISSSNVRQIQGYVLLAPASHSIDATIFPWNHQLPISALIQCRANNLINIM